MELNIKNKHNQTFKQENNIQLGIEVKLVPMLNEKNTGILTEDLLILYNNKIYLKDYYEDETTYYVLGLKDTDEYNRDFELHQFEIVNNKENNLNNKGEDNMNTNKLNVRIKYFEGATKLQKIVKGNWIDVYARKDVFVPTGERAMIPLGFALELPQGWEGHLAPRSSTFKTWGIIQTNSVGVVDDSYIGDNDEWHMPVYCLTGKEGYCDKGRIAEIMATNYKDIDISYTDKNITYSINEGKDYFVDIKGTWIHRGDKIGQFRIMEVMPEIEFEEVESFGNADRGGFGSTGTK